MARVSVRPAVEADLERINAIWYQNEVAGHDNPPPPGPPLAIYPYLMERGALDVAVNERGATEGFGAAITWSTSRGALTYLSDLFIDPAAQSRGAGQALMAALMPDHAARCVMASKDPRATALYIRSGMLPEWPNYWLEGDPVALRERIARLPGADLTCEPAGIANPEFVQRDRTCCGFTRPDDLTWLARARDTAAVWLTRAGQRVGYACIQRRGDESLWNPDAWTVGPVGAWNRADAAACVGAAVRYAVERAPWLRLAVPGPHPALAPLIEAGLRIVYLETYLASPGATPFDPARYLPGGLLL